LSSRSEGSRSGDVKDRKRGIAVAEDLRKTGISVVGDLPWGTHFCYFYETKQDLLDSLVPYFKAGLESKEYCLWLISEPLTIEEAGNALRQAVPDLDGHLAEQSIEILPHKKWFLERSVFDLEAVIGALGQKLDQALARGYPGMRFSGNPAWLGEKDEKVLLEYEKALDQLVAGQPIVMSCTFQLATTQATAIFEVVRTHQFAGALRQGNWESVETPELKQTKAELKVLNEELDKLVLERTRELEKLNEDLRKDNEERRRLERQSAQIVGLVEYSDDAIMGKTVDGIITAWNKGAEDVYGYSEGEVVGKPVSILVTREDEELEILGKIKLGEHLKNFETVRRRKDGQHIYMSLTISPVRDAENRIIGAATIGRDITARKEVEEALRKKEEELEAKSVDLEEANTALKVLLRHREEDKAALEKAIVKNVEESVFPYIERLKSTRLDDRQAEYLNVIRANLENVVSPFLQKVTAGFANFTPMESEVAQLIRSGKTSKEIAALLGLSKRTIDTHRDGIRRKMGLLNKKANLRTHLVSLNNT
jgi:PAS domain S-box-containing protein